MEAAWLARLPGSLGAFLATSGCVLGTHELLHAGIVSDYVHTDHWDLLIDCVEGATTAARVAHHAGAHQASVLRLARAKALSREVAIHSMRSDVCAPPELYQRLEDIDRVYAHDSLSAVVNVLQGTDAAWARGALGAMQTADPAGLVTAFEQIAFARRAPTLGACFAHERLLAASLPHMSAASRLEACAAEEMAVLQVPEWAAPFEVYTAFEAGASDELADHVARAEHELRHVFSDASAVFGAPPVGNGESLVGAEEHRTGR